MKIVSVLLLFVIYNAKAQTIQECDFNKMHLRFEIDNIVSDDVHHKYLFEYSFIVENYDSVPKYIAVEDPLNDSTILSRFSGVYCLNRILKFYFGTCDESRLPMGCLLRDQSLYLKKVGFGGMLKMKKTVNTEKKVTDALKKAQLEIVFAYFNSELFASPSSTDQRNIKKLYWDSKQDMKQLYLKINMQNFKELKDNGKE